jgi:membrane-associated phospholipid phosphatase
MKAVRTLCVIACLVVPAAPAPGETARPFRRLFNAPLVAATEGLRATARESHLPVEVFDPGAAADARSTAQAKQADAPPQHTGFAALVYSTAADFKAFPRRRSTWVILGIGAGAAALGHPADDSLNGRLAGSRAVGRMFAPGKYLGSFYVQVGTATALYVVGRYVLPHAQGEPRTNRVSHLAFDLFRALAVSQALTQATKYVVRRDRPTGECCAFPSGHASATFATASVLERHLGYRGAWPTFVIASYVAASRLHDNRHFLSDVLFGSALGIASGWTVVGRHGRSDYTMLPLPTRGGMMIAFSWNPRSAEEDRD